MPVPRCFDSPPSLRTYLLLTFALHLPAIAFAHGFPDVDQQFQYVEPGWHLATGLPWHRTWEWIDGVRSHVHPAWLSIVLRPLAWLGVQDALLLGAALRAFGAVLALLPCAVFWLVVMRWRPLARPQASLWLFACSGLLATCIQPNGYGCGALLAVTAALAVHGPAPFPAIAGLCLGLAFCARPQEALFGPPLLGWLLWQRRFGAAAAFALGCVPGILLQGAFDLLFTGRFLSTPFAYVAGNLDGAADKWRQQPVWFYLLAGVVPVLALLPFRWGAAWAQLRRGPRSVLAPLAALPWHVTWARLRLGASLVPAALLAAAFHLAVHSSIGRKALRFEYGSLLLLLAVIAVGLGAAHGRCAVGHLRALFAVQLGWLVHASLWFGNAGAVRAATWLDGRPDFDGRLVVAGGDASTIGGFFHLRPDVDRVVAVTRDALDEHLDRCDEPVYVVTAREPLTDAEWPGTAPPEPLAIFAGCLDLRRGERRFVYRWPGEPRVPRDR